ncbi:unnamed protein product [marine sediment metagenome]|uniref:Lipoprotein n=1 Tax=marine sediment metagenome TaxID=412755 RepID=X0Z0B2_9ZZZZ
MAKSKIIIALSVFITLGCSAQIRENEMSFKECIVKCIAISRENDIEKISYSGEAPTYLLYLCGTACKEKATDKDFEEFRKGFTIKDETGVMI